MQGSGDDCIARGDNVICMARVVRSTAVQLP